LLPGFWKRSSSRKKRITTILVFLLLWEIATAVGLLTPLSQADANSINQQLDQERKTASVESIFGHNLILCLVMFVPIGGPIFGFFSSYSSGVVMVAQSMSPEAQGLSPLLLLLAYFLIPIYWLENISMSIGMAESVWLIRRTTQGYGKREIRNAAVLIAIATLILLVSAVIEIVLMNATGG
jgi:hypothetical protein